MSVAALHLLEREAELSSVDAALGAAKDGRGRVVVLDGPAGIGKTTLLSEIGARARARGFRALSSRGGELEQDFAFGVVRQLLERTLVDRGRPGRARLLEGAASLAETIVDDRGVAGERSGDATFGALHGLYWLAANLAAERPLLLVVDDAQWCDGASREWLLFLARRIDELPIVAALGRRVGSVASRGDPLAGLLALPHADTLTLAPLSATATAAVVGELAGRPAHDPFCGACHAATGGSPYLLRELLRAVGHRGPASGLVDAALPPVGARAISSATLLRLSAVAPAAPALAQAVAVLGVSVPLSLAAQLAGLTIEEAGAIADAMVEAELLTSTDPLELVHPLLGSALYEDMAEGARAEAHRRAASVLEEAGHSVEAIAAQLLRTRADARSSTVEQLRVAASAALARGAPASAARYLARAVAEPPQPGLRAEVMRDLGVAEFAAHDPGAVEHLEAAIGLSEDGHFRAGVGCTLGKALFEAFRIPEAIGALQRAIGDLGQDDAELSLALETELLFAARMTRDSHALAVRQARRLRSLLEGRDVASPAARRAIAILAIEAVWANAPAREAAALARRALNAGPDGAAAKGVGVLPAHALILAEQFAEARAALDAALQDAQRRGSAAGFSAASTMHALLTLREGRLDDAEAHARAALDAVEFPPSGLPQLQLSILVNALVERGELAAADAVLAERALTGELGDSYFAYTVLVSRGRLRAAQARAADAVSDLCEAGRRQAAWSIDTPAIAAWRSDTALAMLALGDRAGAERAAEEEVTLARAFGAPRALSISLRALGLVRGATDGERLLEEAVTTLKGSGARLELARALVDLGAARRRTNRRGAARAPLAQGLDLAERCGARVLAATARTELAACGTRPSGPYFSGADALTASERRVAAMAAEGMANREIAQALFVTSRTVESHLARVYGKLGIHARRELSAALQSPAAR